MPPPIIQIRSLQRSFPGRGRETRVLDGLDLDVEDGAVVAIRGRSGAGKSTLLGIMGGLDSGFTGDVRVAGRDLATMGDRERASFRNGTIGFVFQAFGLIDDWTCTENVMLPAMFARRRGEPIEDGRLADVLGRVGMADMALERPRAMSGGQRQRVAIARALIMRPRILLCDEPTGSLDEETGGKVLDILVDTNRGSGTTVVIVTHEERVTRVAGMVMTLEGGRIA